MALSGIIATNHFSNSTVDETWMDFNWTATQDKANNCSNISWNVTAKRNNSNWVKFYNIYINVNGDVRNLSGSYYNNNEIASGKFKLEHNATGDGNFSMSMSANVYYSNSGSISGNGTCWLDNIPRYLSSMNAWQESCGLNWVKIKWNCGEERDWTGWSFQMGIADDQKNYNGSSTYQEELASDGKSGWFLIKELEPGMSAPVTIKIRRKDSQLSSYKNINVSTKDKATITSPSNNFSVNSDSSLTVKCNNPSGNDLAYFLDCPSGTRRLTTKKIKDISYTWSNDDILAMLQYFTTSNSNTIKVGIITYGDDGISEYYNEKVGILNVVDSNPIFLDFIFEDTNTKTNELTGNNQILVNNYSNLKAIISTENKAIAQNSATMKSYKLTCGTKNISKDYSSNADVELTVNSIDASTITVYATDSRGNTTSKSKIANFKNYSELAITSLIATRQQNGVGSSVLLQFEGTYWNNSFGAVTNAISQCIYKYKLASADEWINGTTPLSYSASNGKFSGSMLINGDLGTDGFNISNVYNIRLQIADKLETKIVDITLPSGQLGLAIAKKGVAVKQKYNNELGGALQVNGVIYALDTNNNTFIDIIKKIKEIESKL